MVFPDIFSERDERRLNEAFMLKGTSNFQLVYQLFMIWAKSNEKTRDIIHILQKINL